MEKVVEDLKNYLDYENNYYFYHETSHGNGDYICDEGLLLTGDNILGVKNILFTTVAPLTSDLTTDNEYFECFLRDEIRINQIRDVSEIVILGIPKEDMNYAVEFLNEKSTKENEFGANYIIDPKYILGYVNLISEELVLNEFYFDYNDDYIYLKSCSF